ARAAGSSSRTTTARIGRPSIRASARRASRLALRIEMARLEKKDTRVVITTKFGEIELKLYFEVAPKHCESFVKLAALGFYNGTTFHRVNPAGLKVIQGGDPNSKTLNRG